MVLKYLKGKLFVSCGTSFLIFVAALLASGLWAAYFFPPLPTIQYWREVAKKA